MRPDFRFAAVAATAASAATAFASAVSSTPPLIYNYDQSLQARFAPAETIAELNNRFMLDGVTGLGYFENTVDGSSTCALIDREHVLFAAHYGHNIRRAVITFYDEHGETHLRTVRRTTVIQSPTGDNTDVIVARLDQPLPDSVRPLPVVRTHRAGLTAQAFSNYWSVGSISTRNPFPNPSMPQFLPWASADTRTGLMIAISGDSGSPALVKTEDCGQGGWAVLGIHSYSSMLSSLPYVHEHLAVEVPGVRFVEPLLDFNEDSVETLDDILLFIDLFTDQDLDADLNGDRDLGLDDILYFTTYFDNC